MKNKAGEFRIGVDRQHGESNRQESMKGKLLHKTSQRLGFSDFSGVAKGSGVRSSVSRGVGVRFDNWLRLTVGFRFWGEGYPKGPKYLYGTKYGFCSSNFPHGLGEDSPYGYLGP